MSTGFDVSTEDVIALLSENVERGASLLAGGSRLAGPAAAQDAPAELIPGAPGDCVGVGLVFEDGTAVATTIVRSLASELCGGDSPEQVVSGLQVVSDELVAGMQVPVVESVWLADADAVIAFLSDRPVLIGSGIFDGDEVVGTVAAANARGTTELAPDTTTTPAPAAAPAPTAAPASTAQSTPTPGPASAGPVSDAVLARGLALLADVNLQLTAELGRAHLRVSELLALEPGAVVDLDREAGSPVDLLVNGTLFARAEVIVIDNNYAVRITELVAKNLTP